MKRILSTWILTMMLCLSSVALFSQSAAACGAGGCAYNSYSSGYASYHHGYRHHGYGYGYHGYSHGKYFNCKSYSYDCCSGCTYPVVTTYKTCVVPYRACSYDNCSCCPKWYTYYKRYTYAVKTVKYHCPVRTCNTCNTCNSCSTCNSTAGY